jgi:hypothetical protein
MDTVGQWRGSFDPKRSGVARLQWKTEEVIGQCDQSRLIARRDVFFKVLRQCATDAKKEKGLQAQAYNPFILLHISGAAAGTTKRLETRMYIGLLLFNSSIWIQAWIQKDFLARFAQSHRNR